MLKLVSSVVLLCSFTATSVALAGNHDLRFNNACRSTTRSIVIGFGGDLLMHTPLQNQGQARGFSSLWSDLVPLFKSLDLTYLNLETPLSTRHGHSSYPMFNTSPAMLRDLLDSGVSLVSTANNHALDKGPSGVDSTIDNLQSAGMRFFGTRRSNGSGDWHTVVNVKGLNLAFVACTFSTNGNPDPYNQALRCYVGEGGKPNPQLLALVNSLAHDRSLSAIIVTPHWGNEYSHVPDSAQTGLAQALIQNGALAVVGTHPHVVQPWDKVETQDGYESLVVYSTGNFVSGQGTLPKRTSAFVLLGIGADDKYVWINGVRYLPLYMERSPLAVHAADNYGDALKLAAANFGTERRLKANDQITTTPECDVMANHQ